MLESEVERLAELVQSCSEALSIDLEVWEGCVWGGEEGRCGAPGRAGAELLGGAEHRPGGVGGRGKGGQWQPAHLPHCTTAPLHHLNTICTSRFMPHVPPHTHTGRPSPLSLPLHAPGSLTQCTQQPVHRHSVPIHAPTQPPC
eukprot:365560-Chlamydomonas_euryale.AAC.5